MSESRVELVGYREVWPREFAVIGGKLRGVLGGRALRIDHIGSTAVAGLVSKDVIDVQVTVGALEPVAEWIGLLTGAGLEHRPRTVVDHRPPEAAGPESDWRKLFFNPGAGERRCNIHVRENGRPNQVYPLLVRDFLRVHPRSAEAYGRLKRLLAPRVLRGDYPDVKDPVCDLIYEHARAWAAGSGWRLGASDA